MRFVSLLASACAGVVLSSTVASAQMRTLSGRVADSVTHETIRAARITVVGGRQIATTNDSGQYRITLPASEVRLNIQAIGYAPREVVVATSVQTLDVTLDRAAVQLNEVVVSGAATTQERRNMATAVATVDTAIAAVPAGSIDNALQGKIVGANINMNSGAPGGGGQIQLRGVTTILGNGDPLFVVDGVIISNATLSPGTAAITRASGGFPTGVAASNMDNAVNRLADISPDEIESIQVLKSAAASAIYGSQATNGVIIISTKRGRSGATAVRVEQALGESEPVKLLGSRHFTQQTLAGLHNSTAWTSMVQQVCPGSASTACPYFDEEPVLYGQRSPAFETTANASGGNDQTTYYALLRNKTEPGTLIHTGARRQEARLNLLENLGSRWTGSLSLGAYRSITDRGVSNNDNDFASPIYALAYTPAVVNLQQQVAGRYVNNQVLSLLVGTGNNPFQVLNEVTSAEDVWRTIAAGTAKFSAYNSPAQSLMFQASGGADAFNDGGQTSVPPDLQSQVAFGSLAGEAVQTNGYSRQINGMLSAVHTWTPTGFGHQISSATTSIGTQYEQRYLNQYSVAARGTIPGLNIISQGSPTLFQAITSVRNQALFASEEVLAFNERLSLNAHVRGEQSSANGDANKDYYFPGVAAAYHLPTFASWIDDIKLRASDGFSGNQPTYGSNNLVIANPGVVGGLNTLAAAPNVGNPTIHPERMQENEYGADGIFWNSRVSAEASYFARNITDLLLQAGLAPSSGYSTGFVNGGHMRTTGVELGVNVLPIRKPGFTWTSHTTFYKYTSTMVQLPVPSFVVAATGFGGTGGSFGTAHIAQGYKTTLIWGNKTRPDGTVVDTALADANPRFQMGFSNDFQFRNFSINALLDWRSGGSVLDMTQYLMDEGGTSWDYDQPSPDPKFPNLGAYRYGTWNGGRNVSAYIQDGSYVKLREITVSYALPQSVSARYLLGHDASLKVSGRNLHTWSKYWSFDPEVNNFGDQQVTRFVDIAPYPASRSFYFTLAVSY